VSIPSLAATAQQVAADAMGNQSLTEGCRSKCCCETDQAHVGGNYPEVRPDLSMHEDIMPVPLFRDSPLVAQRSTKSPGTAPAFEYSHASHSRESTVELIEVSQLSEDADGDEVMSLRRLMKRFVQELVRGQANSVVVGDGSTEPCKLFLTPNLLNLRLSIGRSAGVVHEIPLKSVVNVSSGKMENTPVQMDDLCATVRLKNRECVTFRFDDVQQRDQFARCVKVLALALED